MQVPLPLVEVWEGLQAQVEQLTGEAGLRIIGTILENEVMRRVGPPHRPGLVSGRAALGAPAGLRGGLGRRRFPCMSGRPYRAGASPA